MRSSRRLPRRGLIYFALSLSCTPVASAARPYVAMRLAQHFRWEPFLNSVFDFFSEALWEPLPASAGPVCANTGVLPDPLCWKLGRNAPRLLCLQKMLRVMVRNLNPLAMFLLTQRPSQQIQSGPSLLPTWFFAYYQRCFLVGRKFLSQNSFNETSCNRQSLISLASRQRTP